MSIKGIDTQIMVQRPADMLRETSSLQRHPETTQEHLAAQQKLDSALNQSKVLATTESDMDNIRTDVDGSGSGAAGGEGSGRDDEEMTEEQKRELLVPPSEHEQIIDIMI